MRLPADLACAGRTVRVPLKLAACVGSVGWLAWAKASGCPWVARTCALFAGSGNLEALQWAREHNCPWDGETGWSAAERGHLEVVEWLITDRADLNYARPPHGATPLYIAAQNGNLDVMQLLVDAAGGVNVNKALTGAGYTPLYVAVCHMRLDVVECLIDAPGVNVNQPSWNGTTPLEITIANGHAAEAQRLRAAGAAEPRG